MRGPPVQGYGVAATSLRGSMALYPSCSRNLAGIGRRWPWSRRLRQLGNNCVERHTVLRRRGHATEVVIGVDGVRRRRVDGRDCAPTRVVDVAGLALVRRAVQALAEVTRSGRRES
jgi:hypothetical protein